MEFKTVEELEAIINKGKFEYIEDFFGTSDRLFCKYVECKEFKKAERLSDLTVIHGMGEEIEDEFSEELMFQMYEDLTELIWMDEALIDLYEMSEWLKTLDCEDGKMSFRIVKTKVIDWMENNKMWRITNKG